ncbi:hypothetical protein TNCV_555831 [Trichonephila clavipes]|uniref:Uncharacterized protein n=1 Tax=Trichonephila clavipes TaxID=2585209 RepID=A0A8X6V2R9_TRICX|nr:hypothetical protein TNCV_555831 [Trichonephila clavipes]
MNNTSPPATYRHSGAQVRSNSYKRSLSMKLTLRKVNMYKREARSNDCSTDTNCSTDIIHCYHLTYYSLLTTFRVLPSTISWSLVEAELRSQWTLKCLRLTLYHQLNRL